MGGTVLPRRRTGGCPVVACFARVYRMVGRRDETGPRASE